jgi:glycosyltransferase involved in cell wall biosynthesis
MKRIGVAFPGDPSQPSTWSGTPAGVMRGLVAAGAEPVAIRAAPSPLFRAVGTSLVAAAYLRPRGDVRAAVRSSRAAALASPRVAGLNSRAVPASVRRAGRLDGIVQIGTGYTLPGHVPVATFEDMTVAQARSYGYDGWELLSPKAFESRLALQQHSYERAVACCLTSHWAADSVIHDYGVAPSKVHVVGVGRNHTAAASGRDWSTPRFLFVGMDWARKNGAGVLRAFAGVRSRCPSARLDLVGVHPQVAQPGVVGHGVLSIGARDQREHLERLFAEATCFVMPSHSEACGIAYVEAAAAGLPSIGTTAGGSYDLIGDGGLLVDPADDEALLLAMWRLTQPSTAERLGAAARRRARLFTWEAVGRRLLRALGGASPEEIAA